MEARRSRDELATMQLEIAIANLLAARTAREFETRRIRWSRHWRENKRRVRNPS
jgi:hypothetical protein